MRLRFEIETQDNDSVRQLYEIAVSLYKEFKPEIVGGEYIPRVETDDQELET